MTLVPMSAALVATLLLLGSSSHARAAQLDKWACTASYYPAVVSSGANMGNYGYIKYLTSDSGTCSGSLYTGYICSSGASDTTNCDTGYLYNSEEIQRLFISLARATATSQRAEC